MHLVKLFRELWWNRLFVKSDRFGCNYLRNLLLSGVTALAKLGVLLSHDHRRLCAGIQMLSPTKVAVM